MHHPFPPAPALASLAFALTAGVLLGTVTAPAAADELALANGDRLTGTAGRLTAGVLAFETPWGGDLAIAWDQVAALTTEGPRRVRLADGSELVGAVTTQPSPDEAAPEAARQPLLTVAVAGLATAPAVPLPAVEAIGPPGEPAVALGGSLAAGLLASSGNTDTETTYLEGELVARSERNRYSLAASLKESEDGGRTTASRTAGAIQYDHFLSERWYFSSNATFTEDEFQDLALRSTVGLASGFQALDTGRTAIAVELGLSHVDENFLDAPDRSFPAGRWSLELAHRLGAGRIELFHRHQGLVGIEDTEDLLLTSRSGVRFKLVQKLVAALQLNLDYDRSPAAGREKEDRTLLLNLGVDW